MISTAQAILTIYPNASPINDFMVEVADGVENIVWINVSPLTPQQIADAKANVSEAQFDAGRQALRDAAEPDLATLRDQATQAVTDINTYLGIADGATNAQVRAEVKAIDLRQRGVIKALARVILRQLS